MVQVTVVSTEGSTYTKAGHRILISEQGQYQGLVSGGCLEGDLAEHARHVLATGQAQLLTYDLRDENDELFGLGIGCNGLFRVLLQPLVPENGYAPFSFIAGRLMQAGPSAVATVVESRAADLAPGATAVADATGQDFFGVPAAWWETLLRGCANLQGRSRSVGTDESVNGQQARVLYSPVHPLPSLLILGAGLDAVPLVNMARQAGWRVTVADHRAAYLARGDLENADEAMEVLPAELTARLQPRRFSAVVVMSHHLATDRLYLRALADAAPRYVGLLGPAGRRDRLLEELGTDGADLRSRLHAPAGLSIGADSPESIALAILAEIHASLADHLAGDFADGRALQPGQGSGT